VLIRNMIAIITGDQARTFELHKLIAQIQHRKAVSSKGTHRRETRVFFE
jgi:hypothetical protein